jgi:hypothetical protein
MNGEVRFSLQAARTTFIGFGGRWPSSCASNRRRGSSVVLAATQLLEEDDELVCSVNRNGIRARPVKWAGSVALIW